MASLGRKKGCLAGGRREKPKTPYPSRESAQAGLEWMVENLGALREQLRVYECRYSPRYDPHFHVGHPPDKARRNHGRMPARGGNHRR